MSLLQMRIESLIGPLYLIASEKGLQAVEWQRRAGVPLIKNSSEAPTDAKEAAAVLVQTAGQLEEYFRGRRKNFDLPLDLHGTDFQKKVWQELCRIPYGETRSYKDLAVRLENPGAMRAVGGANGKNPICIIVPCHRVIAADGTLGGYSGRKGVKQKLLALERGH